MRVPETHIDIINEKTRAILSTINDSMVFSAFCQIICENDEVLLGSIDEEQIRNIGENEKVSIITIDPSNIGRWFCIQGIIKSNKASRFQVNIKKIIKFP